MMKKCGKPTPTSRTTRKTPMDPRMNHPNKFLLRQNGGIPRKIKIVKETIGSHMIGEMNVDPMITVNTIIERLLPTLF